MPRASCSNARRLVVGLLLATPITASAQSLERDRAAHVRYLGLNVAIGATSAIARAVASGGSVREALAKGVVGGSLMSGGMELLGMESRSTRFAGLQLTAVGASVARNVGEWIDFDNGDVSHSSKTRSWQRLHLLEFGKAFSMVA